MTHEQPFGETREWYTPPELFDALGLVFDVDVASPMSGPVPWVPAHRFLSLPGGQRQRADRRPRPRENGLMEPWTGRVWCNPPYGPAAVAFVSRMVQHGNGMLLVPARTETRWFQHAASGADAVTFLRERLWFTRADGYRGRASHASVLFAFGPTCALALRQAELGWTLLTPSPLRRVA